MKKALCLLASLALLCTLAVGCATAGAADADAEAARQARGDEFRQQLADGTYPFLPNDNDAVVTEEEEFGSLAEEEKRLTEASQILIREFGPSSEWNPQTDSAITVQKIDELLRSDRLTSEERTQLTYLRTYMEQFLDWNFS